MVNLQPTTLRPGLLVSLATSVTGNVSYAKEVIEEDHAVDGSPGKRKARWETTRFTSDAAEHEAAVKVRGKARSLITSVCAKSRHGLLCPDNMVPELDKAIGEAQRLVDEFNLKATITEVEFYLFTAVVAQDDVQAVKAISAELVKLMNAMEQGVRNMDTDAIREAALKAKDVGQMLSESKRAEVEVAVKAARAAATKAKAMLKEAGEAAVIEVDLAAIRAITEARGSFLDLDAAGDVQAPVEIGRGLDLELDGAGDVPPAKAAAGIELEF